jgi:hypothetical protein
VKQIIFIPVNCASNSMLYGGVVLAVHTGAGFDGVVALPSIRANYSNHMKINPTSTLVPYNQIHARYGSFHSKYNHQANWVKKT